MEQVVLAVFDPAGVLARAVLDGVDVGLIYRDVSLVTCLLPSFQQLQQFLIRWDVVVFFPVF